MRGAKTGAARLAGEQDTRCRASSTTTKASNPRIDYACCIGAYARTLAQHDNRIHRPHWRAGHSLVQQRHHQGQQAAHKLCLLPWLLRSLPCHFNLKVKRSFTQRKWGRLRCSVPSSPSQRQRQHQHQRTRTDRRWLAEVQTPHRPAAPGRLVRSSDGDVNRFPPHRPAAELSS